MISILTPSIPERAAMLSECELSVEAQTYREFEHLVMVDEKRVGCAVTMNKLAAAAVGEWLLPLADDDLILPGCLASLLDAAGEADVVYSPPLVSGNEDRWWFFQAPPVIPSFGLIRADLWRAVGGYNEALTREEDRDFWVEALEQGARFVRVEEPTWIYRQWAGNKSFAGAAAA